VLPLRDTIPARSEPVITVTLIGANVFMFFHEVALGPELEEFLYTFGSSPPAIAT
jgi:hypothetical protein